MNEEERIDDSQVPDERYPLGYNQLGLYFLCSLHPDNTFYNYLDAFKLTGNVDRSVLIEAYKIILQRHPAFRTRIVSVDGKPEQYVSNDHTLDVREHEASEIDHASELVYQDTREIFDLEHGPLLRLSLVDLPDGIMVGVISHHILVDKWSMANLRAEVADIYRELSDGQQPSIKSLPFHFGEFTRERIESPIDEESINYWKNKLAGSEALELPYDHPRPEQPTHNGGHLTHELSETLSKNIRDFSTEQGVTPFNTLLAAYYVLLQKYTAENEISVGVPFSRKESVELEKTVGFFDETLVLRVKANEGSFEDLVSEVQGTTFEAFEHRDVPLDLLVKELVPERSVDSNPLFQAMFIYHKFPTAPDFGSHLEFESQPIDFGVTKFDLTLFVGERENRFQATFEYATDLFEESTIKKFHRHFEHLLSELIANPTKELSEVSILTKQEQETLKSWNDTHVENSENSVLELIKKQVQLNPDGKAITNGSGSVSYQELEKKSNQIASFLQQNSIKKGEIVGLHFGRSVDMVISMLGVLKSGAAYLPIDPDYPESRVAFMLEDSGAKLVLTDSILEQNLAEVANIQSITEGDDFVYSNPDKNDPAYVIYTSGSTGNPKGVVITHGNLLSSTQARYKFYEEHPGNFLLFSSFSFDSSVAGIYWSLCSGGNLVIGQKRIEQDVEEVVALIHREQISHTLLLPTLYNEIITHGDPEQLRSFKCVIVAGEACNESLVKRHSEMLPDAGLFNEYGPTEATVWATACRIDNLKTSTVPIGKPITNTQIFILDEMGNLVSPSIVGEIYIGGHGVSPGYLNRPDLNSEKFISSPFDGEGRLYRTGDIGVFLDDGNIKFMGRKDSQLKIRGFRVEIGEIEETIKNHPDIQQAVAEIKHVDFGSIAGLQDSTKDGRAPLVAYFTADGKVEINDLRSFLEGQLPAHMVPVHFVQLAELPTLPNGKVDRKSLPTIIERDEIDQNDLPKNSKEKLLTAIWSEVLSIPEIGINENFFSLGGDSILSIQVISKARKNGLKIAPPQIFKHQTVRELARHVDFEGESQNDWSKKITGATALSPIQTWFFEKHQSAPEQWNQAVSIPIPKSLTKDQLSVLCEQLVARHDIMRLTFQQDEDWTGLYKEFKADDFLVFGDNPEEILQEVQRGISLSSGPIFKLIECENKGRPTIVLLAHHLIVDVVSWGILVDDVTTGIDQILENKEVKLGPKSTPYFDWVNHLTSGPFEKEIDYWNKQLPTKDDQTIFDRPDLSFDYPLREKDLTRLYFELDEQTSQLLKNEALETYSSKVDELILTAYLIALKNWTGTSKLMIGLERHGREQLTDQLDLSSTVGWFTAFFPQHFSMKEEIERDIISVKEQLRSIPNGGVGFGVLKHVSGQITREFEPRFVFNYLGSNSMDGGFDFVMDGLRHPESETDAIFELNTFMQDQKLHGILTCPKSLNEEKTDEFIASFKDAVQLVVDHCLQSNKKYTPSDYEEAGLEEDDLDALMDQL